MKKTYPSETVEKLSKIFDNLPDITESELSTRQLIVALSSNIKLLRNRGYTWENLVKILTVYFCEF
jgi:hypothetical protein